MMIKTQAKDLRDFMMIKDGSPACRDYLSFMCFWKKDGYLSGGNLARMDQVNDLEKYHCPSLWFFADIYVAVYLFGHHVGSHRRSNAVA